MSTPTPGNVYIFYLGYDNLYKIGKAKDVLRRFKALSAANPLMKIIYSAYVNDDTRAEKYLHKLLDGARVDRELFRFSHIPRTVRKIDVLIRKKFQWEPDSETN